MTALIVRFTSKQRGDYYPILAELLVCTGQLCTVTVFAVGKEATESFCEAVNVSVTCVAATASIDMGKSS
jgi:hypothetical protein